MMRTGIRNAIRTSTIVAVLLPGVASPNDLLSCVDRDIREALLTGPSAGSPAITEAWSPGVPRIAIPPAFDLIGSRTLRITSVVALRSALPTDATQTQIDAALLADGWRALPCCATIRQTGFYVRAPVDAFAPRRYCRGDSEFLMTEVTEARPGRSYVTLMTFANGQTQQCSLPARTVPVDTFARPRSNMPSLLLPDGVHLLSSQGGGSISGESTSAHVRSTRTSAELLETLQAELASQGWQRTSHWQEGPFAGAGWQAGDGGQSAVLTITGLGSDEYDLRFTLISRR